MPKLGLLVCKYGYPLATLHWPTHAHVQEKLRKQNRTGFQNGITYIRQVRVFSKIKGFPVTQTYPKTFTTLHEGQFDFNLQFFGPDRIQ
jgi:hypothetical protein